MKKGNYFKMERVNSDRAEIFLYGDIISEDWRTNDEEMSAVSFRNELQMLGDVKEIDLRVNSGGGSVFEALAIYNMIKRHPAYVTAYIDGVGASAASAIPMAANKVVMPSNAVLMIHNAWNLYAGDHNELRKFADDLERINESVKQVYVDKNPNMDVEELSRLMDKETWLSADEALELGLIDEVISAVQVAASVTKDQMARYENAPSALKTIEEEKPAVATPNTGIDKEYLDNAIQQLKNELADLKKPAEPVKDSSLSAFFLNIN